MSQPSGTMLVMPSLLLWITMQAPWPMWPLIDERSDWLRPPVTRIAPPDQLVRHFETGLPVVMIRRSRAEMILASVRK